MKKYFYLLITFVGLFFIGFTTINAAQRVNIIQYSGGTLSTKENSSFSRTITNIDNDEGTISLQLKFKNSKSTEVMFVVDDSTTITSDQSQLITTTAGNIATELLDNYSNIKFGVYGIHPYSTSVTSYENEFQSITSSKQDVLSALNSIQASSGQSGQDIVSTLSNVKNKFSVGCENKIVFLLISGFDTNSTSTYLNALQDLEDNNITVVNLLLDFKSDGGNSAAISNLFGSEASPTVGSFFNVTTAELTSTIENNLITKITDTFPTNKTNVIFNETFLSYLTEENFGVITSLDSGYDAEVSTINPTTFAFTWTINSVINNSDSILNYTITLPDELTTINYEDIYNINGDSTLSVSGTNYLYDYSPAITFTDQVANPSTGFIDIVIPTLMLSGISLLVYTYIKSKEKIAHL